MSFSYLGINYTILSSNTCEVGDNIGYNASTQVMDSSRNN